MDCVIDEEAMRENFRLAYAEAMAQARETGVMPKEITFTIPTKGTIEYCSVSVTIEKEA